MEMKSYGIISVNGTISTQNKIIKRKMKILVTGAIGFIGSHLCNSLLNLGYSVVAVDSLSSADGQLNKLRMVRRNKLNQFKNFIYVDCDLANTPKTKKLFESYEFDVVYHLAAFAGVQQSSANPYDFTQSNLVGFANILEGCRTSKVPHLIFASSSSVYGDVTGPSKETNNTDQPKSYYAATKKANEVMAASYSNLYGMRITGARFFTVYGEMGRPDMATWKFTDAILNNLPITLYDKGELKRDFTHINQIIYCLEKFAEDLKDRPHLAKADRFQIFNVGGEDPIPVNELVSTLEEAIGKKAIKIYKTADVSEVKNTHADMKKFRLYYSNYIPKVRLDIGLKNYVSWYTQHLKF
jgi:UDP-glucuronate 4-epimerase